ncbi:MAG: MBL fold metallo-hydrolase [Pseudomonadota bacterium]
MNDIPFVKEIDFEYGVADQLSPLIRRVIANNPGPFTFTGTGTYIVGAAEGGESVAVIDPGPDLPAHFDALEAAINGARVSHILITHTHGDHCGGARAFADRVGAPIYAYGAHPIADAENDAPALDEGGDYGFRADETLADGDTVTASSATSDGGWTLQAVHTPGHLSNHLCFALQEENALFSGDHVMGWATSVVAPPDGNMAAYLKSLDKLLERTDARYYPTHGAPINQPQRFVRAVKAHRLIRDGQIIEQLKAGRTQIKDMVPTIYAGVDPRLHGAAALNVLAHLIRLVEIGSVKVDGPAQLDAVFEFNAS